MPLTGIFGTTCIGKSTASLGDVFRRNRDHNTSGAVVTRCPLRAQAEVGRLSLIKRQRSMITRPLVPYNFQLLTTDTKGRDHVQLRTYPIQSGFRPRRGHAGSRRWPRRVFRGQGRRSLYLFVENLPDREVFACHPEFRGDDFPVRWR